MRWAAALIIVISVLAVKDGLAFTLSGTIPADETWSSANNKDTLHVTGDVTVTNNVTLTIAPGTVIRAYNGPAPTPR